DLGAEQRVLAERAGGAGERLDHRDANRAGLGKRRRADEGGGTGGQDVASGESSHVLSPCIFNGTKRTPRRRRHRLSRVQSLSNHGGIEKRIPSPVQSL